MCLGRLLEGVGAVDHGPELAGFDQLRDGAQVLVRDGAGAEDQLLVAGQRRPEPADELGRVRVGDHVPPARTQEAGDAAERRPADDVEDDIEVPGAVCEVALRVVDDLVGAELAEHLELAAAVDRDHLGAGLLGQLDRVGAETAAGADDEDPLPGADAALAQEAERLHRAVGHGGGLGIAQGRRHGHHDAAGPAPAGADGLGVGAEPHPRCAVHAVPGREAGHPVAERLDLAGELLAEDPHPRPEDAERQADGEPDPRGELEPADLAVRPRGGRGMHADEHLARLGARRLDLLEPEDVRAAVRCADDRLHGCLAVARVACAVGPFSRIPAAVFLFAAAPVAPGPRGWASRGSGAGLYGAVQPRAQMAGGPEGWTRRRATGAFGKGSSLTAVCPGGMKAM